MKRSMMFCMLSVLTAALMAQSAEAQTDFASCVVRPFDPICQVMGSVYRQRAEIRIRNGVENEVGRWRNAADMYGVRDYTGAAIVPAIVGRPIGRREGAIAGAGIGAGIGGAATGSWRGAEIGRAHV